VRQVGYLQGMYRDARSAKHKIQFLYCRVIDAKWVGNLVRGGVRGLFGHTIPAYALRARRARQIETVQWVYNSRRREYKGRLLPSQHLVEA